jgi:Stigma-specific protein, Stig1
MMKWEVRALLALCCLLAAGCPNSAGITCPNGQQYCNGQCISVTNDQNNCGSCGKACSAQLACIHGSCGCPGKLTNCTDVCTDTNVDASHCGTCGNSCGLGEVCSAGTCARTCGPGLTECSGSCVDTGSSPANCGTCGKVCGANNFCVGGQCTFGCPAPLMACNNGTACFDVANDPNNCGTCGNVCGVDPVDGGTPGLGSICCGGMCVSPDTVDHCGGCAACPAGTNTCIASEQFFCING